MGLLLSAGVGPPFRPDQKVKLDKSEGQERGTFLAAWPPADGRESHLGLPSVCRKKLSKNEVLPGLTYFYSNSVSQAGKVGAGLWSRTMSAARQATSRKAREVAHPQLFRCAFKGKPGLYFAVKVAHPPFSRGW